MKELQELQEDIGEWSDERGTSLEGMLNHLIEEARDLKKNPYNAMNHADVLILALSIARKTTYNVEDLLKAVKTKMEINKARIWLEPDSQGIVRHKSNE